MRDNHALRIRYIDVGGLETEREIEPQYVVVGPNGSYLTAWCHLREDDRVFRMDRITRAELTPVAATPSAASSRSRSSTATRPSCRPRRCVPKILLANTDTGLSRPLETVEAARRPGG